MEFKFVAPIASAAAATPLGRLQPETATTSARPATRAVMIRMGDSLSRRKRAKRRAGTGGYYSFRARTRYRCERRIRNVRRRAAIAKKTVLRQRSCEDLHVVG